MERAEVELWYDFPSIAMLAVYKRMGINVVGELSRLVYPLRIDHVVEPSIKGPVGKAVSSGGNLLLAARELLRKRDESLRVEPFEEDFRRDFEPGFATEEGVYVVRSASYLNWRFRRDPRGGTSVLAARREGVVGGHIAFRREGDSLAIVDAFGIEDDRFLRELVLGVIDVARAHRASGVSVGISDRHPWVATFEQLGFHRRGGDPLVVYARPGLSVSEIPWCLMSADRDQ